MFSPSQAEARVALEVIQEELKIATCEQTRLMGEIGSAQMGTMKGAQASAQGEGEVAELKRQLALAEQQRVQDLQNFAQASAGGEGEVAELKRQLALAEQQRVQDLQKLRSSEDEVAELRRQLTTAQESKAFSNYDEQAAALRKQNEDLKKQLAAIFVSSWRQ